MRRIALILALVLLTPAAFADRESREVARRAEGRAVILHPARALSAADMEDLAAEGVIVKHALAGGRYLARVSDTAAVQSDARVQSIEELTPEKKIHRSALRAAASGRPFAQLNVVFQRDVPFDEAVQAITEVGGATEPFALRYVPSQRIEATVPSHMLETLASDDRVLAISAKRNWKVETENATSAQLSHVTELYSAPYGLSGAGVTVSLFELGEAQADHPEFQGRLTLAPTTSGGAAGDRQHATHVAGTIGAAGLDARAKGMAPAVKIQEFCVRNPSTNKCEGNWLNLKQDNLAPLGIVADNNSWGYVLGWQSSGAAGVPIWNDADVYWGAYDLEVGAPLDEISSEKGVLFVHSAGNDGSNPGFTNDPWKTHVHVDPETGDEVTDKAFCVSRDGTGKDCPTNCSATPAQCELTLHHSQAPFDTMGVTASAKNVVAVGAVGSNGIVAYFSSRGPAKDGRVKPDVVARGTSVFSTIPTSSYGTLNGTSMSSPAVTGMSALLVEQWRKTNAGANPTAAQLKALLIAGAQDLGNPGPDYTYGFGLVNAKNSVDLIIADNAAGERIRNLSFPQGQNQSSQEVPIVVSSAQNLRVVLFWPDPAIPMIGNDDIAAKALVNDLDLKVIDPTGGVHLPYVLDKNNPSANATTGVNTVDNTEVVEIANATPGTYRVIATGTTVNQGPQKAVLISNVRAARPCVDVQEASNNTEANAYGNIPAGQLVSGGLCTQGDVDFYKFLVTKTGPLSVSVTTGDTPVRATLSGNGVSASQDIPANSTATVTANVGSVPNTVVLKLEAAGSLGAEPQYSFVANFGQTVPPRRRTSRH